MLNPKTAAKLAIVLIIICSFAALNSASAKPAATITLKVTSGAVGDTAAISGSYFGKYATVTVSVFNCQASASKYGSFSLNATVPKGLTAGVYTVTASDTSGNTATASFTVKPAITYTPSLAASGSTVTVNGSGFTADSAGDGLKLAFGAKDVALKQVANGAYKGTFTASFVVPDGLPGPYTVTVTNQKTSSVSASATFNVLALVVTPENPVGVLGAFFAFAAAGLVYVGWSRRKPVAVGKN